MSYYYPIILVCMSTDILFIYMYVLLLQNCISMYDYSQYSQYTSYSSLDIDCLQTVIHMLRCQDVINLSTLYTCTHLHTYIII